ncbi:hypothetical protein Tco_1311029 [Tanacetum coccineum]
MKGVIILANCSIKARFAAGAIWLTNIHESNCPTGNLLQDNWQASISTSVIPKVGKSNALSKPVTLNSAPSSRESSVVNNERVIAPGIFRINPFKALRVDNFVPNKHVKASVRTKPITVSQPHVITKKDVNSNRNGFSPKDVESTTRTRRPQPRNNPKKDKAPTKSKSSCLLSNLEKIKENHRNLQSSSNQKHMSSECNNIKLAIRNAKSKVVCAMCKQCLITAIMMYLCA